MAAVVASCSGGGVPAPRTVHVDIAQSRPLAPDTSRIVCLEVSDSSLLYGVDALIPAAGRYVVGSRTLLRSFDARTGRYLGDIARYNGGESGFSNILRLWHDGDTIRLFDSNARTIASYLPDGTFLGKTSPLAPEDADSERPPRQLYALNNGNMLAVNGSTGGSTPHNPMLSLYDGRGRFVRSLAGREVQESAYLTDGAHYDSANDRMLLWEPLRDTVFVADCHTVRPLYAFDFGTNAMPGSVQRMPALQMRARAFNAGGTDAPYASLLRYLQTDGTTGDIYFCFADSELNDYIARYNEHDGALTICRIATPDGRYVQSTFFLLDGDSLRVEMRERDNVEANPGIYTIAKSELR